MSEAPTTDAGASFDELVVPEQSANKLDTGAPAGDKPAEEQPKPAEGQPEAAPEGQQPADGQKPEDGGEKPEGDLFWGKFKSPDDAKTSYDAAQTKIIEQGTKLNELTKANETNASIISAIDAALAKNPELAKQLEQALTDAGETQEPNEPGDIDSMLDKKLDAREQQKQQKAERDEWVKNHPDFTENDGELGHKIMDILEKDGLPITARTLEMAYDHVTKDAKIAEAAKKASEEALKKEELAELDRQNGAGVGGGANDAKPESPQGGAFDALVGESLNPNKIRL